MQILELNTTYCSSYCTVRASKYELDFSNIKKKYAPSAENYRVGIYSVEWLQNVLYSVESCFKQLFIKFDFCFYWDLEC